MPNILGFLKKIAPFAATALSFGGPLGAMAGNVINTVVGTKITSLDDLSAAFAKTPDQQKFLTDLKTSEQQFQVQMKQLEINSTDELEKIMAGDRASARQMQVTTRSWLPPTLALLITFGFFFTLFLVFHYGVKPEARDIADLMLGTLGTAWVAIVTYYFGSSSGSAQKTAILANINGKG